MSEIPKPIPNTAIQDYELAVDMAHKEAPFRDVAQRLRGTGQAAIADIVVQQGIADAESLQHEISPAETEIVDNGHNSKETQENHERILQEATDEVIAVFDTWFAGNQPSYGHFSGGRGQLQRVYTHQGFREILPQMENVLLGFINVSGQQEYSSEGIDEAILVSPEIPNITFGDGNPDSRYKDDPVTVIRYQTLRTYIDPSDRDGAYLRSQLFLPKTVADALMEEVGQNQHTMRELVESIMDKRINAGEDWQKCSPPYEEWKDANGGIEKMLILAPDASGRHYEETILESKVA
ncbi:hypothetical protein A3D14_02970 [Candidatus Saccharibacteria bacterium RIFCSPHIGHO2_02_FULL_47_12]|nr:MAG: hypothetical protein A3D14_02970 [Candidatus Saccharibacteria bacterium RIFCSPHIGHO2_02_FULL_47_12]